MASKRKTNQKSVSAAKTYPGFDLKSQYDQCAFNVFKFGGVLIHRYFSIGDDNCPPLGSYDKIKGYIYKDDVDKQGISVTRQESLSSFIIELETYENRDFAEQLIRSLTEKNKNLKDKDLKETITTHEVSTSRTNDGSAVNHNITNVRSNKDHESAPKADLVDEDDIIKSSQKSTKTIPKKPCFKYNRYSINMDWDQQIEKTPKNTSWIEQPPTMKYLPMMSFPITEDYYPNIFLILHLFGYFATGDSPDYINAILHVWDINQEIDIADIDPRLFILSGILSMPIHETIAALRKQGFVTILTKKIEKLKLIPNEDPRLIERRSEFILRISPVYIMGGTDFMTSLYHLAGEDEGIFILGLIFVMSASCSTKFEKPSPKTGDASTKLEIESSVDSKNQLDCRDKELPLTNGAKNHIINDHNNLKIGSNNNGNYKNTGPQTNPKVQLGKGGPQVQRAGQPAKPDQLVTDADGQFDATPITTENPEFSKLMDELSGDIKEINKHIKIKGNRSDERELLKLESGASTSIFSPDANDVINSILCNPTPQPIGNPNGIIFDSDPRDLELYNTKSYDEIHQIHKEVVQHFDPKTGIKKPQIVGTTHDQDSSRPKLSTPKTLKKNDTPKIMSKTSGKNVENEQNRKKYSKNLPSNAGANTRQMVSNNVIDESADNEKVENHNYNNDREGCDNSEDHDSGLYCDIADNYYSADEAVANNEIDEMVTSGDQTVCVPEPEADDYDYIGDAAYSELLYDELDQDPEFLSLVEYLADLFPKVSRTELKFLLKTTDNLEELIESLFLEEETLSLVKQEEEYQASIVNEVQYSNDVYVLKDMFPNHDNDVLQTVLDENRGDLQLASNALLTGNVSGNFEKIPTSVATVNNQWDAIQDSAGKLHELLGLSNGEILSYLHSNQRRFVETLVDIIKNHRKPVPVVTNTVPKGGRVQRGRKGKVQLGRNGNNIQYRYGPGSSEYQELSNFFSSNVPVQEIGFEFLAKALNFFEGDFIKVMNLCQYLIDEDYAYMISKLSNRVEYKPEIKIAKPDIGDIFKNYSNKVSNLNSDWKDINQDKFETFKSTGKLDLHRLKLAHGLQITRQVLGYWWTKEMDARINEGRLTKYGSTAEFSGTVEVITGRGIHSVNGVSILKQEVLKYLQKNQYLFNEGVGRFEVYGKKIARV